MLRLESRKILFVGDLNQGTRSLMRAQKLKDLCDEVVALSNTPIPFIAGVHKPSFIARAFHKLRLPCDDAAINHLLQSLAHGTKRFDVLWIEKSCMLRPKTLKLLKHAFSDSCLISVSEDDMYAMHNRSRYYEACLPLYDAVFTTKTYNLEELKKLGARRTEFFLDSYDELLHRPLLDYSDIKAKDIDVSFVGTYEEERAETIKWLVTQGVRIIVFGNGWSSLQNFHPNLEIQNRPVYGGEYVEIINRSKINLGFLRKINRDQVTSRSMEITGSAAFLLAERTNRHMELFEEGIEADFFSSNEELLKKITEYLASPERLRYIGLAGRDRCISSGYEMQEQIVAILNQI